MRLRQYRCLHLAVLLVLAQCLSLRASASAIYSQDDLLKLPTYDIEWAEKTNDFKVGDTIELKFHDLKDLDVANLVGFESLLAPSSSSTPGSTSGSTPDPVASASANPSESSSKHQDDYLIEKRDGHLRLSFVKAGTISLPSLVIVDSQSDPKPVARTNPVEFKVLSTLKEGEAQGAKPAELRGPLALQFPLWLGILLGVSGLLLLSGLFYLIYRLIEKRRNRKPKIETPKITETEDVIALRLLDELEKADDLKNARFKRHYFAVSEIAKNYFGGRYDFDAAESTSHELMVIVQDRHYLNETQLDELEKFFFQLDRVKFTDHVPDLNEGTELLQWLRMFIRKTRRVKLDGVK